MKPKIYDYFSKEFILFVVCSGISAVVNFFVRIILTVYIEYAIAIVLAYICGIIVSFTLNKIFVFNIRTGNIHKQLGKFIIINFSGVCITLFLSLLFRNVIFPFIGFTFYVNEFAHVIGLSFTAFTSFLGHKYFSFKIKK